MKITVNNDGALLTDGDVIVEKISTDTSSVGNIYKGRILRRLPHIKALSVDIGTKTPAFLPVSDAALYNPGDEISVEVVTDARDNRGCRMTEELSLSGFYAVLLFGKARGTIGVSKNIKDDERRLYLKGIVRRALPKGMGVIIRTEASDADDKTILDEIKSLLSEYEKINKDLSYYSAPKLVLNAGTPERALRRLWSNEVREIVFSSDELMARIMENLPESIEKNSLLYTFSNAADEITKTVLPIKPGERESVRLPCGGNIVIDVTEALTVIDVNSGECKLPDKEATAFTVNIEAAHAIVSALRRRRVSGMIVIDFIDMEKDEHRARISETMENNIRSDTARCKLFGFTNMGLFEMTRKPRR